MLPADSPFARLPAPGLHPTAEELRAYAAGSLAPAEEHRIELHTQDCGRCADVVEGFAMTDAATTDQAVATLRTRLQARIGATEPEAVAAGWVWPRVAAAVALLGLVGGGIWSWEQREVAIAPATARLEAAVPAAEQAAPTAEPAVQSAPASPGTPPLAAVVVVPRPPKRYAEAPPVYDMATPADTVRTETAAAATKAPRHSDYAVVLPSQPQRRSRAGRLAPATSRASDTFSEPVGVADQEMAAADDMAASRLESQSNAAPLELKQPAAASAPAPVLAKKATDTLGNAPNAKEASGYAQDKAMAPPAVAAAPAALAGRGPAMRMPAVPSIGPAPVGGTSALRDYVRRQVLAFEPSPKEPARSGTVRVQFIVGADGKLSALKVTRSLGPEYDAEALRIVCDGPAWRPGIAGGRRAPSPAEVTVSF